MLALLRSTRGAKGVSRHVRALSTIRPSASSPDAGAEQPDGTPLNNLAVTRKRRTRNTSAECMFVFPWDGIRSSAEGLAIACAVQEKYGPAREVIFPRDPESITVFQPYFWLVFDNTDVRERFPEESGQTRVRVADLPRGDGNIGVEDMLRGLGFSTEKGAPPKPHPPAVAQGEGTADVEDAADGYKNLDIRVEWARYLPSEIAYRRRPLSASLPREATPEFASAWLAFDGFSPDAARGANTPNLIRAREKWRDRAPPASATESSSDDPIAATGNERASEEPVVVVAADAEANVGVPREWIPIFPLSPSLTPPRPTTVPKSEVNVHLADDVAPITMTTAAATAADAPGAADVAPTFAPDPSPEPASPEPASIPVGVKMSRRERILHIARQNAQTPLPELGEQPQAVVEAKRPEGESEQEGKERTIRERLWRLVGGNY